MLNQELCYKNGEPTRMWCAFEAVDDHSIWVEIFYIVFLIGFAIFIIKGLFKIKRSKINREFVCVYYMMIGWVLCSIIKVGINIGVYYDMMSSSFADFQPMEKQPDVYPFEPIVTFSIIFASLDSMSAYFLLFPIITIPHQWLINVMQKTNENKIKNTKQGYQERIFLNRAFNILKVEKVYTTYIRQIFPVFLVFQFLLLLYSEIGCYNVTINTSFVVFESLIILSFYAIGAIISNPLKKKKLIEIRVKDYRIAKCEYIILVLVMIVRVIVNLIFTIIPLVRNRLLPQSNCSYLDQSHKYSTTVFLILLHYVMHLVPAGVVLYIFSPNAEVAIRSDVRISLFEDISNFVDESETIISGKVSDENSMKSSNEQKLLK